MTCPMEWWYKIMGYDRRKKAKPLSYTPEEDEYTVKHGDTPESIAAEYLDDAAAWPIICSYNGLLPEEIVPGVKIYFPKNKD